MGGITEARMSRVRQLIILTCLALGGAAAIRPNDVLPIAGRFVTPLFAQQPGTGAAQFPAFSFGAPEGLGGGKSQSVDTLAAAPSANPEVDRAPSQSSSLVHAPAPPPDMLLSPLSDGATSPLFPAAAAVAPAPQSGPGTLTASEPEPASQTAAVASIPSELDSPGASRPSVITKIEPIDPGIASGGSLPAAPAAKPLIPAKTLFGAAKLPADLVAKSIGSYAHGCLAGAEALPADGPSWQVMRLSRNRNWGHPKLVALVEKLAVDSHKLDGWPGLLVGDISQPRGGPMLTGHASHQIGLDADVWLTPMPNRTLSKKEREEINATSMLDNTDVAVDPKIFTEKQVKLIKRAASYPQVERVLVHPAIKKALCQAAGTNRGWLGKVRPIQGHYYHFHMRIGCPSGSLNCEPQKAPTGEDGCGKELDEWLARVAPAKGPPPPRPPGWKPAPPKPPLTLAQLPAECTAVLESGPGGVPVPADAKADAQLTLKVPAALRPHLRKLRAAQKN